MENKCCKNSTKCNNTLVGKIIYPNHHSPWNKYHYICSNCIKLIFYPCYYYNQTRDLDDRNKWYLDNDANRVLDLWLIHEK